MRKVTTPGLLTRTRSSLSILLLSPLVLLVHGYHPLADDGAVYVAGIKKLINPTLYPADAVFALAPTRFSVFAHVLAALVRWTHLPLAGLLLLCHITSILLFLLGCFRVAQCIFPDHGVQWGAVLLSACCFTLPIAGTSLSIMDPYVTARSFSTPLTLIALAASMKDRYLLSGFFLVLAFLLHPLMAAYATIAVACVAIARHRRWLSLACFCGLGWVVAGILFLLSRHADLRSPWSLAALSRSYFFLSSWQWYEYLGLVVPLMLLAMAAARAPLTSLGRSLAIAAAAMGCCALLTSLCFVHRSGSLWLARLQVLRAFQWVYLAGILLAGGLLGSVSRRHKKTVAAIYIGVALALLAGARATYAASRQVEWPGLQPINRYQQAFVWIRDHTPRDAFFTLDNDYIEAAGEDAQGFRATAERSTVADYLKDGGIATNAREAAELWEQGSTATDHLNQRSDRERIARLRPLGVTWIVLPSEAVTHFACPFTNAGVRVCRLGVFIHGAEGAR